MRSILNESDWPQLLAGYNPIYIAHQAMGSMDVEGMLRHLHLAARMARRRSTDSVYK